MDDAFKEFGDVAHLSDITNRIADRIQLHRESQSERCRLCGDQLQSHGFPVSTLDGTYAFAVDSDRRSELCLRKASAQACGTQLICDLANYAIRDADALLVGSSAARHRCDVRAARLTRA